jgi:hypothetical protein
LVDCTNVSFSADILPEWALFQSFFSRFFMKVCIGYAPSGAKEEYPFSVYRSRHKAVAMLEAEGNFMGDDAHCRSAKSPTK